MITWQTFYRLLGIPEAVTDPTYYQLLGVQADRCDCQAVRSALEHQLSLLRGNVPGPQFIPLIMIFEKDCLRVAADTLSDPDKRRRYDEMLADGGGNREFAAARQEELDVLVREARQRIYQALNDDGTLSDDRRPALGESLHAVGVPRCDIPTLLGRIPKPSLLPGDTVRIVALDNEGVRNRGRSMMAWSFAVPLAAVLLFIIVYATFNSSGPAQVAAEQFGEVTETLPTPEKVYPKPTAASEHKQPATSIVSADELRRVHAASNQYDNVLADLAVTMLACCDRSARFVSGSKAWDGQLRKVLKDGNSVIHLADRISFRPVMPIVIERHAPPMDVDVMRKEVNFPGPAAYVAIERLRTADTSESADVLISALRSYARSSTYADRFTTCRILRALGSMSGPDIPHELAKLITTGSSFVSYQVVRTLAASTGIGLDGKSPGNLSLRNNARARRECQQWWQGRLSQSSTPDMARRRGLLNLRPFISRFGELGPAEDEMPTLPAWNADNTKCKLIALSAHYAAITADQLSRFTWGKSDSVNEKSPRDYSAVIFTGHDVGEQLLEALKATVDELRRIAESHPNNVSVTELAAIEAERMARSLACDTVLQRAAVNIDSAGNLLALIVSTSQGDADTGAVLHKRHQVDNVLHEMRESAYCNVQLWDMLLNRAEAGQWL